MKICKIMPTDLLTIIEDVGFGKAVISEADRRGIIIDGYLDLVGMCERINVLIDLRHRSQQLADYEQPR
jgi:hypothetical protein